MITSDSQLNPKNIGRTVDPNPYIPTTESRTLKRGQRVNVFQKPITQEIPMGVGVLTRCNDSKVYHTHHGFENWNVKMEGADESLPTIVHARDLIKDE